jgi:hypothetical protein
MAGWKDILIDSLIISCFPCPVPKLAGYLLHNFGHSPNFINIIHYTKLKPQLLL